MICGAVFSLFFFLVGNYHTSSEVQLSTTLAELEPLGDQIKPSTIPANLFMLSPKAASSLQPLCPCIISSILKNEQLPFMPFFIKRCDKGLHACMHVHHFQSLINFRSLCKQDFLKINFTSGNIS